MKNAITGWLKSTVRGVIRRVGYRQSDERLARDAQEFWRDTSGDTFQTYSHWRGGQGISDETWLELGAQHLRLFEQFLRPALDGHPLRRVIEWGCGGGANAIHFAKLSDEFIGVDVSQPLLDECGKVLRDAGVNRFQGVLVDVAQPEQALSSVTSPCDLFLCTYVFELIPTPEYGERLVDIAKKLLRPGGVAMIQIKYTTIDAATQPKRWGYKHNAANMTSYPIDTFWELAQKKGFTPIAVTLQPRQDLIDDGRYAYFFLQNPGSA